MAVIAGVLVPGLAMAAPSPRPGPSPGPSPSGRGDASAIAMASESNLEWPRSGFRISIAVGPALQVGSIKESSGAGGGLSIRVGTASTPRLAWMLEAVSTAYLAEDNHTQVEVNRSALLVLGAQWHATEAVWVRGGLGFAQFTHPSEPDSDPFGGVGASAGWGFDVLRRGTFALSAECAILGALYGSAGQVVSGFCGVGATAY